MDLTKLLEIQNNLDERIIDKKGLQTADLLSKKILALQVEVGELANEWRGFKFWSEDQEPRFKRESLAFPNPGEPYLYATYPLLEEYVDCVHFFLSIANEKGWQDHLYIPVEAVEDLREEGFDGGITGAFSELLYFLSNIAVEKNEDHFFKRLDLSKHEFSFRSAWFLFISIGIIEFDFSFEQIEQAYHEKNLTNHQRQDAGY